VSNNPSDSLTSLLGASGLGQSSSVAEQLTTMADQLEQLRAVNDALVQQTAALTAQASTANSTGAGSGGSSVLDTIGSIWGGGFGLAPLISGLAGLFGGGDAPSAPPAVTPYVRPLPVQLDAGFSYANGGGPFAVDAAQGGLPRAVTSPPPAQITVQVQAMDSQSFLDHSADIARAVRQAMLETTVLNDVIREV
jgi:hypothetical protein